MQVKVKFAVKFRNVALTPVSFYASVLLLVINCVLTLSKCCRSKTARQVDLKQTF